VKDVHIRKAQESDLHEIKSLMLELIESLESEEGIDENVVLKNCRKILKAPNAHLLVAELDGEIVGVLHLNVRRTLLHSAPSGLIDELVVSERHRGKGIGRKLIEAAVELSDLLPALKGRLSRGKGLKCAEIEVSTEISNLKAREFYKSMGFEEIGVLLEMDLD